MRHITPLFKTAALLIATALTAAACGGGGDEFAYDSSSYFPENYQSAYSALPAFDCTPSPTHGGDHVRIWVSPELKAFYEGAEEAAANGGVVVKSQYSDSSCSTLSALTVMRRDSEKPTGWEWQRVEADGSIALSGAPDACTSCHSSTPTCVDYVCAKE